MDVLIQWFMQQVQHNDVFAGLVGGSFLASVLYKLRSFPNQLWDFIVWQTTVSLIVTNDDSAFENLNEWLARLDYAKRVRKLRLTTWYDEKQTSWVLAPGEGRHVFFFRGRLVHVRRTIERPGEGPASSSFRIRERLEVMILGRSQDAMRALVLEAQQVNLERGSIKVYLWDDYWELVGWKPKRPATTLALSDGQLDRIASDMKWFMESQEWYRNRGIPYRRGYLFHGPPGTGKSSLVSVLAGMFSLPVYTMNLSTVNNDNALLGAFSRVPPRAILLIEDVDATTASKKRKPKGIVPKGIGGDEAEEPEGVSMSGFLNAIDGVASPEGRILIMTTNYPDKLDDALVRPGRVDVREEMELAGDEAARKMFLCFYGDQNGLAGKIVLPSRVPPAMLQQHFMRYPNPREAVDRIGNLAEGMTHEPVPAGH